RPAGTGDAAARRDGGGRENLARGAGGTRPAAHASGIGSAGRGDRRTGTGRPAGRADLVRSGANAATGTGRILAAGPDAESGRPWAATRDAARVETHAYVLAHPAHAAIRGTGISIVALPVARAGWTRQGRGRRRRGPAAADAGVEAGGALRGPLLRRCGAA